MRYSLLTIAPKGRGDSGPRSQVVEVQPEPLPGSGKSVVEAPAIYALGSKDIDKAPYRAILNGRAELMEVLGSIFDTQAASGLYFWIWPFKLLIDYAENLRARLSEEESKFRNSDQKPESDALPPIAEEAEDVAQKDDSGSRAGRASKISPIYADSISDLESGQIDQVQAGQNAAESAHKTADHDIKVDSFAAGEKRGEIKADRSPQNVKPETHVADDTRLRDELRCLVTFMDTDLKDVFSVQKDIDNGTKKMIAFDHLWQLYKPGHVVVSGKRQKQAYVVLHVTGGRTLHRDSQFATAEDSRTADRMDYYQQRERREKEAYFAKYPKASPFVIDCFYLDFDGTKFGPLPQKFTLAEYDGEVAISSLEVYPMKFGEDPKKMEKSLVRRGRKFVKLASVDHKYYSGQTIREAGVLDVPGEVGGLACIGKNDS